MPLLNGKPLAPHNYTKKLRDDEEVFFCELTNEIFEDYQGYCERVISCSCMIWNCAITGKGDLTYQEALESEERALRNIKDLSPELRTPVLYLASLTERKTFASMADDVFLFLKERFCKGEAVDACFEENDWTYSQINRVIMPTPEEVISFCDEKGYAHPIHSRPYPAELYKYEVEELIEDDSEDECAVIRVKVLSCNNIRRFKGVYSKDKNRAYLKQFSEQKKSGRWVVKSAIIDKYAISTLNFSDIFVGEPPLFNVTNNLTVSLSKLQNNKNGKLTQQSMKSFLVPGKENWKKNSDKPEKKAKKSMSMEAALKIQKKYAATIDKVALDSQKETLRKEKLEQMKKVKEEKRQEKEKLADFARQWQRKREDLECEDLKELPSPCPVDFRIPNQLFGDFVMILEFLTCFKNVLNVKDYFQSGLSFELLERALMDVEVAGPFSDLLQLLLTAVFEFQGQEDDEVRSRSSYGDIKLNETNELSVLDAVKLATQAARWSRTYHNVPLNELHFDAITVTDILRLHLLSSGGRAGDISSKWRFQERGGYTSTDDPGFTFRMNEPEILKFLTTNHVAALPIEGKLKIVSCLMNQILTYASVRDVIDELYEQVCTGKKEIKVSQIADSKKEKERLKQLKENKEKTGLIVKLTDSEKESLQRETEKKKLEYQRRWQELQEASMKFQVVPLGEDRGHRRFWIFSSISGLFVEDDERWPGKCLPQPSHPVSKAPVTADEDDTMSYIRKLFEEGRSSTGSDKENEGDTSRNVGTPKKKLFGETNGGCPVSSPKSEHTASPVKPEENRSLICTADEQTCPVHNPSLSRTTWCFYYREEEVDELIKALNKRGYREHALREILTSEKERVLKHVNKCPVAKLNRFVPVVQETVVNKSVGTRSKKGYKDAFLNCPEGTPIEVVLEMYLREVILDIEEKIYGGALGKLKVRDRALWRSTIENRNYDSQDNNLTWPTKMLAQLPNHDEEDEDENTSRPGSSCSMHSSSDAGDDVIVPEQSDTVRGLAMAVLQLARSVEPKFRQKPLIFEEKKPGRRLTVIERWELSLMRSTSCTQVYLHLSSLENSIQWNKSVLNARCKICRRGKDDENMLLCDGCDRGFHLYCLKPKMKSIPRGDWFCDSCKPKEKTPVVRNRRRQFLDEEEGNSDNEPLVRGKPDKRKRRDDSFEERRTKRGRN